MKYSDAFNKFSESPIFIQWEGTDVCLDLNCKCGKHSHIDGYFAYTIRCIYCGTTYALSPHPQIIEVDDDSSALQDNSLDED